MKKILRGHRREETARFVAFRSHWRFESGVLHAGRSRTRRAAWKEKPATSGAITGCRCRKRRIWPTEPAVAGRLPAGRTAADRRARADGGSGAADRAGASVAAGDGRRRTWRRPAFPTVNSLGCVKVLTNAYSVPLPAGTQVQAKAYASIVEFWHDGPMRGSA